MKRKVSAEFHVDDDAAGDGEPRRAPPRLDDCFLAEEIIPRLPAHAAQAFAAAAPFFRGVLTDPAYWLSRARPRRAPSPRAACLVVRGGGGGGGGAVLLHELHYADAGFSAAPAVARAAGGSLAAHRYAGACNGLVLLAAPWSSRSRATGVLLNPASGEEAAVAVVLDGDAPAPRRRVFHCFCGLGYSPSSKAYKALLCARDFGGRTSGAGAGACHDVELVVAPLAGGGAAAGRRQEPRRVATMRCRFDGGGGGSHVPSSLSLDGKVYVFPDISAPSSEVLAFDVDDETVTFIQRPPAGRPRSELMEVWGRPCVATGYGDATMLWTLTPDHRWELQCSFAGAGAGDDIVMVHGAWDCGDGLLFVMFRDGRRCMYEIGKETTTAVAREVVVGAVHGLPVELRTATFCWGYQPTLIPPATVVGDGACTGERNDLEHFSSGFNGTHKSDGVVRRRRCLEVLLAEMSRKPPRRGEEIVAVENNA